MSSNWIENTGRKRSPFAKGTLIDVVLRGGDPQGTKCALDHTRDADNNFVCCGVKAGYDISDWTVEGVTGDVLKYRKHEVKDEQE